MKALTVLQPWAYFLAMRQKRIETRGWTTSYRGPVAIHAGKGTADSDAFAAEMRANGLQPIPMIHGAIIAVGYLVRVKRSEELVQHLSKLELDLGDYSPGRFGWELGEVVPLAQPVPCRGALGLWDLPPAVQQMVDVRWYEAAGTAPSAVQRAWHSMGESKHMEDAR